MELCLGLGHALGNENENQDEMANVVMDYKTAKVSCDVKIAHGRVNKSVILITDV